MQMNEKQPKAVDLLETLIRLLADQNGVTIAYELEEIKQTA